MLLEEKEINISKVSSTGKTPFIYASQNGYPEIVQLLLEVEGVNINQGDNAGKTALIGASQKGHPEVVQLLLEVEGVNINQADNSGRTALLRASKYGHSEVVQLLLEEDEIVINKVDQWGSTSLYLACFNGHTEVVKLLLQRPEIDINKKVGGYASLWLASKRGHAQIVQLLLEHPKTNVNKDYLKNEDNIVNIANLVFNQNITHMDITKEIIVAALLGNATRASSLLGFNETILNNNDSLHRTPLFWASTRGHTEVAKLILAKPGVEVNTKRSITGATALYGASKYGHKGIVEVIIELPTVEVNLATLNRKTPLMAASINGHPEVVEILLSVVNINVNYATFDGKTALIFAVSAKQPDIIELLLRCPQTDTSLMDEEYKTALDRAKDRNQTQYIELFKSRGTLQIRNGHTCCSKSINRGLQTAVGNDDMMWIKVFIVCPEIDINVWNKNGQTALLLAVKKGLSEFVRILLVDRRIDVNKLNTGSKQHALHIASDLGNLDIVNQLLLHEQTFVNFRDADGNTALLIAIKKYLDRISNTYFSVSKLLLRCPKTDVSSQKEYSGYYGSHIQQAIEVRSVSMDTKPTCCLNVIKGVMEAAWLGDFRAIRGLLQCPGSESNINTMNEKWMTPLYIASMMGHLQAVQVLLNNSDVDANLGVKIGGGTPFSIASEMGHFDITRALILNGQADENRGWCRDNWVHHLIACNAVEVLPPKTTPPPSGELNSVIILFQGIG